MGLVKGRQLPPSDVAAGYTPSGVTARSLSAMAASQAEAAARDWGIGKRVMLWYRVAIVVLVAQFASASAAAQANSRFPVLPEALLFAVGLPASSLVALLICWQPSRWCPRMRELIGIGAFIGTGISAGLVAVSLVTAVPEGHRAHSTLVLGLSFIPGLVIGITYYVLAHISRRRFPHAWGTLTKRGRATSRRQEASR